MTLQKRRVIYMTDPEWALLKFSAEERGESISNLIRSMWRTASEAEPRGGNLVAAQAQRDAILRRVNRKGEAQ